MDKIERQVRREARAMTRREAAASDLDRPTGLKEAETVHMLHGVQR